MLWLIGQIWVCLLLTALLWAALGYLIGRIGSRDAIREATSGWQQRFVALRREYDAARHESDAPRSAATAELEQALTRDRARLEEAAAVVDALQQKAAAGEERITELRSQIEHEADAARAAFEKRELEADRKSQVLLAERDRELTMLRNRLAEATSVARTSQATEQRIRAELQALGAKARRELAGRERELETLRNSQTPAAPDADAEALESAIARERQTREQAENAIRQRDRIITELRQTLQTRNAPKKPPREHIAPNEDMFASKPALLLSQPDGEKDKLQRIHGIGPVLENTLNELGIFHFRQIATLKPTDIAWVAANINSFPDRIMRDRWVDQARKLVGQDTT